MDEYDVDEVPDALGRADRHFVIVPLGVLTSGVSHRGVYVYSVLRSYLRPGHAVFPHIETVCATFGIAESTFRRGLNEVVSAGLIRVSKRRNPGGFRQSNEYYFPDLNDDLTPPPRSDLNANRQSDLNALYEVEKVEVEKGGGRRSTFIPASFSVDEQMVTWARKNAPLVKDLQTETGKFSDWHRAHGSKMVDWVAAWRNWIRKANNYAAERTGVDVSRSTDAQRQESQRKANEFYELEGQTQWVQEDLQ